MEIQLTPDQESTLMSFASMTTDGINTYLYFPYFFKQTAPCEYERLRFDQLPEWVKDNLLKNQGIKLPTE